MANANTSNASLRDLLAVEIENKTRACSYQGCPPASSTQVPLLRSNASYQCPVARLEGYKYCIMHILNDPKAPYTQCAYTFPHSGHRCTLAAPRNDRQKHFSSYCFEHSRLYHLNKARSVGKIHRPETVDAHLGTLTQYVRLTKGEDTDDDVDVEGLSLDPLSADVNAAKVNERSRKILDCASDSEPDEDEEVAASSQPLSNYDLNNSDCESIDSDLEDPLKHAGIFTTEEACRIAREKLIRLRSLYLNQFHRLGYVLREKRRRYLAALRKEREQYCSIANQPRDTPEERHRYAQLKALNKYHRHSGVEAVLRRKFNERRLKAHGGPLANKPLFYNRCTFADGGVKCAERSIPCSKYCRRHIMQDTKQVLFRACGKSPGGIECQEPLPMIFDDATCPLHIDVPPEKNYMIRKYESEPEDDEEDTEDGSIQIKQEPAADDDPLLSEIKLENETN